MFPALGRRRGSAAARTATTAANQHATARARSIESQTVADITSGRPEKGRRFRTVGAAGFLLAALAVVPGQQADSTRPLAIVAELDGIIHPVSAEYLTDVINESDTSGAE